MFCVPLSGYGEGRRRSGGLRGLRRYHSPVALEALNPTIAGSLIGGGAALIAVIVSALGTGATLRANRIATREERLWEKRTALYEALIEVAVSDRPMATIKALLTLQDSKVFAYASDAVLTWFGRAVALSKSPLLHDPEVTDILRTSLSQQDPDEYVDRAMVMRLVTTIREELQGQKSRDLVMWARTSWWHIRR
jgi:hypothetical protein